MFDFPWKGACAFAALTVAAAVPAFAQTIPTPQPANTPTPAITYTGVLSGYVLQASYPNASGALDTPTGTDCASRADLANAVAGVTRNTGTFRYVVFAGAYAVPVVGQAINPTFQAGTNTNAFGPVPTAYVEYVPNANLSISVGKLPTLFGQEIFFTFQNLNIERGLAWNMEPAVSRGVSVTYTKNAFTGTLQYNDGYYSGKYRAFEGLVGWAPPGGTTSVQLAFMLPDPNTPANPTAPIANKTEYDLMVTQTRGKLQLLPYLLYVNSPASARAGFARSESAYGAVAMANYTFDTSWSLAGRIEYVHNDSAVGDVSANADLVGYGPGSAAWTYTFTPIYRAGHFFIRGEYALVEVTHGTPGLLFGTGAQPGQMRLGLEAGAQL